METKFTNGEWIDLGYRVDVDVADGLSGICEMSDWMNKEEMEANAKLIAAAPELLKSLMRIISDANIMRIGESGDFVKVNINSINDGIKAINKAFG